MHYDLNFFLVNKSSSGKSSGNFIILILVLVFALIIGIAYGTIEFLKFDYQNGINFINESLKQQQYIYAESIINTAGTKNDLLIKYNGNLKEATDDYKNLFFINSGFFNKITSAMPNDIRYSDIKLDTSSVSITCYCDVITSPAVFYNKLDSMNIFSDITYTAITPLDSGTNPPIPVNKKYTFNITCTLK